MDPAPLRPALLRELTGIVGGPHVLTEGDERAPYEVDWTGRFHGATPAVVRPGSVEEVAAVVAVCRREGIAIVPQGGNTGMVGGSVPLAGELVVSLRRLDHVDPVDTAAQQVTAGAGAVIETVQRAAAAPAFGMRSTGVPVARRPSVARSRRTPAASPSSATAAPASSSSASRRCSARATSCDGSAAS